MIQNTVNATLLAAMLTTVAGLESTSVTHLPDDVLASLQDSRNFQIRMTVAAISSAVRTTFARVARDEPFAMAEPGAAWQLTDVITKRGLPRRRLGKVALSRSFCFLFYELGGRGHSYHVAVFRVSGADAELTWHAVFDQPFAEPAALLRAIDEGKVNDDPQFSL
jgi:hypothetical protein